MIKTLEDPTYCLSKKSNVNSGSNSGHQVIIGECSEDGLQMWLSEHQEDGSTIIKVLNIIKNSQKKVIFRKLQGVMSISYC